MEIPLALESTLIPLVMLLTCEKMPDTKYMKKYNPEHRTKWEIVASILLLRDESSVHLPLRGGNLQ